MRLDKTKTWEYWHIFAQKIQNCRITELRTHYYRKNYVREVWNCLHAIPQPVWATWILNPRPSGPAPMRGERSAPTAWTCREPQIHQWPDQKLLLQAAIYTVLLLVWHLMHKSIWSLHSNGIWLLHMAMEFTFFRWPIKAFMANEHDLQEAFDFSSPCLWPTEVSWICRYDNNSSHQLISATTKGEESKQPRADHELHLNTLLPQGKTGKDVDHWI